MSRFMPYSILMKITSNFQDKKQKWKRKFIWFLFLISIW
jgi:hypothetical protein